MSPDLPPILHPFCSSSSLSSLSAPGVSADPSTCLSAGLLQRVAQVAHCTARGWPWRGPVGAESNTMSCAGHAGCTAIQGGHWHSALTRAHQGRQTVPKALGADCSTAVHWDCGEGGTREASVPSHFPLELEVNWPWLFLFTSCPAPTLVPRGPASLDGPQDRSAQRSDAWLSGSLPEQRRCSDRRKAECLVEDWDYRDVQVGQGQEHTGGRSGRTLAPWAHAATEAGKVAPATEEL